MHQRISESHIWFASIKILWNSMQPLLWRGRKWVSESEPFAATWLTDRVRKNKIGGRPLKYLFPVRLMKFYAARPANKSKISLQIRAHGGHLVRCIGLETKGLVDDLCIMLPVWFDKVLWSRSGYCAKYPKPLVSHLGLRIASKYTCICLL